MIVDYELSEDVWGLERKTGKTDWVFGKRGLEIDLNKPWTWKCQLRSL